MCYTPIRLKSGAKDKQGLIRPDSVGAVVPCGKCPKCLQKRANNWILRLQQQEKVHQTSVFLTLTYSPEHVPITKNKFMTLNKRDVQLFMKRLRKNTGKKTIKYYFCGEYGTDTWRPHYHAIIFDVTPDEIDKAWTLGIIHTGNVTGDSIAYTTKYICKEKRIPLHAKDDRLKEFSLMSKNMGINYITPQMKKWHIDNLASYVVKPDGYKMALPRYYRDKIFTDEQKESINHQLQQKHVEKHEAAIKAAGSVKTYYHNQFYAIQHAKLDTANKSKRKRNKI